MNNKIKFISFLSVGAALFLAVYSCFVFWYLAAAKNRDSAQAQNHAVIIANDLWNLNNSGMRAYLDLAARTGHYKEFEVLMDGEESFLHIYGPSLPWIDRGLLRLGLVYLKKSSLPIYYDEEQIGTLQMEQFVRHIYPLFYIFLVQFFVTLILIFILYLVCNRKFLKRQVLERSRKYHELVNLLPEMVLETDAEGIITFANEKAQEIFGISNFIDSEHDCRDFIRLENGERGDRTIYLHAKGNDLDKKEYRVQSTDGGLFPVLVRSAPINIDGQFTGARIVIVDITERSALKEQLIRDQKMKSIGMMAGGVAHDLNNILSGIVNYPELILLQLPEGSPLIKFIGPMKEAGLRAAAVVADLLTVARGVAATRELADLNEIIQDYTGSPEFQKLRSLYPDIRYTASLCPGIDNTSCSIIHVRKCLMNLVTNASEAVVESGQVSIETANKTIATHITTGHGIINPGSYVVVSVQDSGIGISPPELSHIFEPFYSKKELGRSGTGLGLAVVWNTMQDHDGGIKVISDESGSTFELYFPRSLENLQSVGSQGDMETFTGNGESVLIVDDELQQRDIASQLLESLGYNVESVTSGEAAIEYVRQKKVDLVLLDMILESGMNGLQTYEGIIQLHPDQKAIIASGYSASDDVRRTLKLGAGGFLKKPYTTEQLARAVFCELGKTPKAY